MNRKSAQLFLRVGCADVVFACLFANRFRPDNVVDRVNTGNLIPHRIDCMVDDSHSVAIRITKQGIEAIQTVLLGKDSSAKRRLLFYLDQYLDPFYQNDLSELNLYRRDCFWHHGRLTHFICFLSSLYDRITETGFFEMQITGKSNRFPARADDRPRLPLLEYGAWELAGGGFTG